MTAKAQAIYDLLQLVLEDLADELVETCATATIDLKISTTPVTPVLCTNHRLSKSRIV